MADATASEVRAFEANADQRQPRHMTAYPGDRE
jgi:hypothetical protein